MIVKLSGCFSLLLTAILIVLKATGTIAISWPWVFALLWMPAVMLLTLLAAILLGGLLVLFVALVVVGITAALER